MCLGLIFHECSVLQHFAPFTGLPVKLSLGFCVLTTYDEPKRASPVCAKRKCI